LPSLVTRVAYSSWPLSAFCCQGPGFSAGGRVRCTLPAGPALPAVSVPLGERAVLSGRVDRLERDEQGRAVVVDLKTGSTAPPAAELARHPQLGVYQLAVALGAFAEEHGLTEPGGAALLQLKTGKTANEQLQAALPDGDEPGWAAELVERVVQGMSGADFPATVNKHCARTCPVRSSCPAWPDGDGVVR